MESRKHSIYFGDNTHAFTRTLPPGTTISKRIDSALERYDALILHHQVTLQPAEAEAMRYILGRLRRVTLPDIIRLRTLVENSTYHGTPIGNNLDEFLNRTSFAEHVALVEWLHF